MGNIVGLIETIQNSDNPNRLKYLEEISDIISKFYEYYQAVIDTNIDKNINDTTSEYIFKQKDIDRSIKHDICIAKCNVLNSIASDFKYDLNVNTSARNEVRNFVGQSIKDLYKNGTKE